MEETEKLEIELKPFGHSYGFLTVPKALIDCNVLKPGKYVFPISELRKFQVPASKATARVTEKA